MHVPAINSIESPASQCLARTGSRGRVFYCCTSLGAASLARLTVRYAPHSDQVLHRSEDGPFGDISGASEMFAPRIGQRG